MSESEFTSNAITIEQVRLITDNVSWVSAKMYVRALDEIERLQAENAELKQAKDAICEWAEDVDRIWETSCGESFSFDDGSPDQNGVKYCHHCGKLAKFEPYRWISFDDDPEEVQR